MRRRFSYVSLFDQTRFPSSYRTILKAARDPFRGDGDSPSTVTPAASFVALKSIPDDFREKPASSRGQHNQFSCRNEKVRRCSCVSVHFPKHPLSNKIHRGVMTRSRRKLRYVFSSQTYPFYFFQASPFPLDAEEEDDENFIRAATERGELPPEFEAPDDGSS